MESFDTPQLHEVLHHLAQSHAEVREIMTAPVVTVHPELDVRHAAELMCRRVLVRVPVVDAEGRLAGIVSRADLLRAVAGGPSERRLEFPQPAHTDGTTPISAIMTHDVPAIRVDTTLRQVVDAVVSTQLNRAVVVDAEERVIGIVTDAELIDRLTPALHPGRLKTLMHHLPFVRATPQQEEAWHHATGNRARDFLIRDIVVACEEEPIREVLARVIEKVRQIVPIVADDQRLVGVVDRIDLLGVLTGVATAPFDP
jgi:CBS domain-containing protein